MNHEKKMPNNKKLDYKSAVSLFQEVRHGFPNKPTALAWDQTLRLLAVATKNGAVRM